MSWNLRQIAVPMPPIPPVTYATFFFVMLVSIVVLVPPRGLIARPQGALVFT
jgi:hypothetical protein